METALGFSGYLGIVLIAFGTLGTLFVQDITDQPLLVAHLVLGVLSLVIWGVTSGLDGFSRAGSALSGRAARFGANAVLYSVIAIGLVVVANILISKNDKRWDVTEAGVYSLSEKSVNIVQDLKGELKLVALDAPQAQMALYYQSIGYGDLISPLFFSLFYLLGSVLPPIGQL